MLARLVTLPPGASPPISTRQTRTPPSVSGRLRGRSETSFANVATEPPANVTCHAKDDES